MKLTRALFEKKYADGSLSLAFVGMSNIGKSYTALRLATQFDFNLIEVDKIIWENLGHDSMEAFANWQGHPYSAGYQDRETHSISLETQATSKALKTKKRNPLIDTTGSVIYIDAPVLKILNQSFYVVYIEAMDDHIERLKDQYFKHPKPLIWAGHYNAIDGLSKKESVLECYPKLLEARAEAYAQIADATLPSTLILDPNVDIGDIHEALKPPR